MLDGTETTETFTWTGGQQANAAIVVYRGVDATTPIDVFGSVAGTSTRPTAPDITTTIADARVLRIVGVDDDDGLTNLGAVARVNLDSGSGSATASLALADEGQFVAGATHDRQYLKGPGAAEQWRGLSVALAPAAQDTCVLLDDFQRDSGNTVGNGWTETERDTDDVALLVHLGLIPGTEENLGVVRLRGDNEPDDTGIEQDVDLSTIVNARVTFERGSRLTQSEALKFLGLDDYLRGEYSLDGGTTWRSFFETDLGDDGAVFRESVALPPDAQGQSIRIRFESDMNPSGLAGLAEAFLYEVRVCGDLPATVHVEKQTLPQGDPTNFDFEFDTDGAIGFVGAESAIKSAGGGTQELVLPVHAGVLEDDLLIAYVATDGNTADDPLAPAAGGWTALLGSPVKNDDGELTIGLWYRFATAAEPTDYTFTWTDGEEAVGTLLVYRGVDTTTPINAAALSDLDELSGLAIAPMVTTSIANATILRFVGLEGARAPSHPGPVISTFEAASSLIGGVTGAAGGSFQPAAGDSGTAPFDFFFSTDWIGATVALQPARVTSSFQLADDASQDFPVIPQGDHDARELSPLPSGYAFVSASCDGGATDNGQAQDDIVTASGVTNNCVFNNQELASLTIVKNAVPNDDQAFAFTGAFGPFNLTDDGGTNFMTFSDLVPGMFAVAETVPLGWGLQMIVCTNDTGNTVVSPGVTVTLDPGENEVCTFTNTLTGSPTFGKEFIDDPALPGGSVTLRFTIDNTTPVDASGMSFTDDLGAVLTGLVATTLPAANFCGTGSTIVGTSVLTASGLSVAAGGSCSFDVVLSVPGGTPAGNYSNSTSLLATTLGNSPDQTNVNVGAAADTLNVVGTPTITKQFLSDPAKAGETVELEFTITNVDPINAASDLAFTDDLGAVLAGLEATDTPKNDVCGAGSSISGTTVLTFAGGSLGPGASCTFSVTLSVPEAIAGWFLNETSVIGGTVGGQAVSGDQADVASATLKVTAPVTEIPTLGRGSLILLSLLLLAAAWARMRSSAL